MTQLPLFAADGVRVRVPRGSKNPLWFGLAGRLKRLREASDLASLTLGNLAGVSHQAATRIERDESVPGIDVIEKLAMALGISPCWLAFGADGAEHFQEKIPRLLAPDPPPPPDPSEAVEAQAYKGCGDRLRVAREASGLSMRQVARAAKLSAQAVSLVEHGRLCPGVDTCEALAVALSVAPCWLAYGVGRGPAVN